MSVVQSQVRGMVTLGVMMLLGLIPCAGLAQVLPPVIDPTGRSGSPPPPGREPFLRPGVTPQDILPPVQIAPLDKPERKGPVLRVRVREIRVVGSTVFSDSAFASLTAPYLNKDITTDDLEELRQRLTLLYIGQGYANSGAVIPDQDVTDGVVRYEIVEGGLTELRVQGTKWFWPGYLSDRIARSTQRPLNLNAVRDRLQLLLQDPRLDRLNAELKPGARPGEAELDVTVREASPFKAWIDFNNFQTPVVGAERGLATVAHQNLTGHGDPLSFTYGQSRGVNPIIDTSYTLPINRYDTAFTMGYRRNDFLVVEQQFDALDVNSQAEIFSVSVRQPLYHTLEQEFALSLTGERLFNKTTLLGSPFEFVPGMVNGVGTVSALRFGQEWVRRTPSSLLAIRSRLSVGLDVLGATTNTGPVADGRFLAWLGQANAAYRSDSLGWEFLGGLGMQFANDRLFPLEQYSVGGRYSVRGYRENQLVRDNAFIANVEVRVPILPSLLGPDRLQLAPFLDVGRSWNTAGGNPDPLTLASIGSGLRFLPDPRARFEVYWGHRLNKVDIPPPGGNLQDHGVHFQMVLNVL